jgi:WG containing repeat
MKKFVAFFIITISISQLVFAQTIVVVNKDYNHPDKYEAVLLTADGKVVRTMNKSNNEDVSSFSEGVWICRVSKDEKDNFFFYSNFLNEKGEKLLASDIKGFAWGFSDGRCLITHKADDGSETCYYVDKSGKEVFKPIPNELGSFYKGVTWKKGQRGTDEEYLYGLINKKGEWILKPTYFEIKDFENGIAQVMTAMSAADRSASQKYAYIDTKGNIVNPYPFLKNYDRYGCFNEGICMAGTKVEINSFKEKIEFTAIDSTGKELFTKKFYSSEIGESIQLSNMVFKNGLCPTSDGYINAKGEVVIQFADQIIADATAFNNGLASFKLIPKNGDGFSFKYTVINTKGKIIWQSVENKLTQKFEIKNQYFSK